MLIEGCKFKNFAKMQPFISIEDSSTSENYVLNYFVVTCIIFAEGWIMYSLQLILAIFRPPDYLNFIDLCSVTNISIIIFDESLSGYYIHGKTSTGNADVSTRQLRLNLESESTGKGNIRGIHDSYPENQTFELFMPDLMVEEYRKYF